MSERMVLRMKARKDEEVVRGRRGKRDLRSLEWDQRRAWSGEGMRTGWTRPRPCFAA